MEDKYPWEGIRLGSSATYGHRGEQESQQWDQMHLGAKENYFKHEEHQEDLDPKGEVRSPMDFRNLETWHNFGAFHGVHHDGQGNCQVG